MTQENKELLSKDLCARLPYFVYVQIEGKTEPEPLNSFIDDDGFWFQIYDENGIGEGYSIEQIKPYLRPISSMTVEERKELSHYESSVERVDFYYSHHLDCRYLIEKGLAIAVTEENNPYR